MSKHIFINFSSSAAKIVIKTKLTSSKSKRPEKLLFSTAEIKALFLVKSTICNHR